MHEQKFFDTSITDAIIAPTMTINNLTIVATGNGESERIGRKFMIEKVSITYSMTLPAAAAAISTSDVVRCMLIQDKQTNGVQFSATDLLDTDTMFSFNNLANSKRFRILYKQNYELKAGGAAASGAAFIFSEDTKFLMFTIGVKINMEYDNSLDTGVITTVRSNNLYWVTQSLSGLCVGLGTARIRYRDT